MFEDDYGRSPASIDELMTPPPRPDRTTLRYLEVPPNDPWTGVQYLSRVHPDGHLTLTSWGADQVLGGEGWDADISSDDIGRPR